MNLKLAAVVFLIPFALSTPTVAQNGDLRELYNLCSRFPFNSRCEGLNIPIPLDERNGEVAGCVLNDGQTVQSSPCKLVANDSGLTAYLEEGEPVELLDNRRGTMEIVIPRDRLLAGHHNRWGKFSKLELSYRVAPDSGSENQTHLLEILANDDLGESLVGQLNLPAIAAASWAELELFDTTATTTIASDPASLVQRLLETRSCVQCDLRGANLAAADLDRVNLEGANLEGANLAQAELEDAYLIGANLTDADLTRADLSGAKLIWATLQTAKLDEANFNGANLQAANLQNASLQTARLNAPAVLSHANLSNANLTEASLQGTNLQLANLESANLQGANLSDIELQLSEIPANIDFVDVLGAFLDGILGVPILALNSGGVRFDTNLDSANLKNANLTEANLDNAILSNTDLTGANLQAAEINESALETAQLCGATLPDGSTSNQGC